MTTFGKRVRDTLRSAKNVLNDKLVCNLVSGYNVPNDILFIAALSSTQLDSLQPAFLLKGSICHTKLEINISRCTSEVSA